jgi:hypothetical protein
LKAHRKRWIHTWVSPMIFRSFGLG